MSLKNVLAGLQKDYIASIPEKMASISHHWQTGKLLDLQSDYHKMKGTGRTYGIPEITQLGAAMEALCLTYRSSLAQTVPLSLAILDRIRTIRERGEQFEIDNDPDFQEISRLVKNAPLLD